MSHREIELTPPKLWDTRDQQPQEAVGLSLGAQQEPIQLTLRGEASAFQSQEEGSPHLHRSWNRCRLQKGDADPFLSSSTEAREKSLQFFVLTL